MTNGLRGRALCGAALLLALAGPAGAQVKEAAELLPAGTLAYIEARHPERLSRELAALTKGSAVSDMAATAAKFRERLGDARRIWLSEDISIFGSIFGPEWLAEGGRLQGAVFALTGISKDGPEMVGVILSGSSNIPGLYLRTMLAADSSIRARGEVEGVTLYRDRRRDYRKERDFEKKDFDRPRPPPVFYDSGPFYAIVPGGIAIGTETAVKEVIRRAKGKSADPSLASVRAYKESARLRDRPGLFAYADLQALDAQMAQLKDAAREWEQVKAVLKPQTFRSVTASLTLAGGELELQARLQLDAKQSSPLLDAFPGRKADVNLLHYVPGDAALGLVVGMSDGGERFQKLLALLDALGKQFGWRDLPGQGVQELEKKTKLSLGKDVFGRIASMGVVVETRSVVPEKAMRLPMLVISATDAEAAKFLEETALPRLLAFAAGKDEVTLPTREKGQDVSELPHDLPMLGKALYCGRQGRTLVIGQDRKRVSEVLIGGAREQGVLADKQVAAAVKALDAPLVVGVASAGQALVPLLRDLEMERPRRFKEEKFPGGGAPPPPAKPPQVFDRYIKDLEKAVGAMQPGVISVTRKADLWHLEFRQSGLREHAPRLINIWIESALERAARNDRYLEKW
jgi:hypothetical protein